MNINKRNIGFSLVELSISLVIAGLIIAAITSGAHLIQAAKMDKVISEISGYAKAINSFKDKYKSWPGDMPDAVSYWGSYAAGPPITGTTNGDGDEKVTGLTTEALQAWRQMSLSNMIGGAYTGVDAGIEDFVIGTNVPASVIKGANYYLYYYSTATTFYNVYGTTGNALQLGSVSSTTSPWISVLTPADAHIIDAKIDDSFASTGNIYAVTSEPPDPMAASTVCVTNNPGAASANYILTDTTTSCRILYWLNKF